MPETFAAATYTTNVAELPILDITYGGASGQHFALKVPSLSDHIARQLAATQTFYELPMLEHLRGVLGDSPTILDVGANLGNHTVFFAGVCGAKVMALEPHPTLFGLLQDNVARNGLSHRVQMIHGAVGASRGTGYVHQPDPDNLGKTQFVPHPHGKLPLYTLDWLATGEWTVDLIKIDVEGMEGDVLRGAEYLIERDRPLLMVEAQDIHQRDACHRFLQRFQYLTFQVFNATPTYLVYPYRTDAERYRALAAEQVYLRQSETAQRVHVSLGALQQDTRRQAAQLQQMEAQFNARYEAQMQALAQQAQINTQALDEIKSLLEENRHLLKQTHFFANLSRIYLEALLKSWTHVQALVPSALPKMLKRLSMWLRSKGSANKPEAAKASVTLDALEQAILASAGHAAPSAPPAALPEKRSAPPATEVVAASSGLPAGRIESQASPVSLLWTLGPGHAAGASQLAALRQTVTDPCGEILVFDNSGEDATFDTLMRVASGDARVRLFRSYLGQPKAWCDNFLLNQARCGWVAFVSDTLAPGRAFPKNAALRHVGYLDPAASAPEADFFQRLEAALGADFQQAHPTATPGSYRSFPSPGQDDVPFTHVALPEVAACVLNSPGLRYWRHVLAQRCAQHPSVHVYTQRVHAKALRQFPNVKVYQAGHGQVFLEHLVPGISAQTDGPLLASPWRVIEVRQDARLLGQAAQKTSTAKRYASWPLAAPGRRLVYAGAQADRTPACNAAKISVILAVYNRAGLLPRALHSLLNQTHTHLEVLVVDDGSTDDTLAVAQAVAALDPRVRVLPLLENRGAYWARNVGLQEATGDFLALMDADEFSLSTRLAVQWAALQAQPEAQLATVAYRRIDTHGQELWLDEAKDRINSGFLMRRMLRDTLGAYDVVRKGADTEWYERVCAVYGHAGRVHVPECQVYGLLQPDCLTYEHTHPLAPAGAAQGVQTPPAYIFSMDGGRAAYVAAFSSWHRDIEAGKSSPHLSFPPRATHLFEAPPALLSSHWLNQPRPVFASLASVPRRVQGLAEVVASMLPQVDRIHVYLNGYDSIPDFLTHPRIVVATSQQAGNRGDSGKFYWAAHLPPEAYHLTLDDDMAYPPDYAARLIVKLQQYRHKALVAVHGARMVTPVTRYYKSRDVFSYALPQVGDRFAHVLGTGTLAYATETLALRPEDFSEPGMADVWLAVKARQADVPMVCMAHRAGWLRQLLDDPERLYQQFKDNDLQQTQLIQEAGPWTPEAQASRYTGLWDAWPDVSMARLAAAGVEVTCPEFMAARESQPSPYPQATRDTGHDTALTPVV
jgi:FkbM family methyltransferase